MNCFDIEVVHEKGWVKMENCFDIAEIKRWLDVLAESEAIIVIDIRRADS